MVDNLDHELQALVDQYKAHLPPPQRGRVAWNVIIVDLAESVVCECSGKELKLGVMTNRDVGSYEEACAVVQSDKDDHEGEDGYIYHIAECWREDKP